VIMLTAHGRRCGTASTLLLLAVISCATPAFAQAPAHECDHLAASKSDRMRVTGGVDFDRIDFGPAINACNDALKSHPDEPRFLFQLGRALSRAKRDREAERMLVRAASFGYIEATIDLSSHYFHSGNYKASRDVLEQVLSKDDPRIRLRLGVLMSNAIAGPPNCVRALALVRGSMHTDPEGPKMLTLVQEQCSGLGTNRSSAESAPSSSNDCDAVCRDYHRQIERRGPGAH